jgi:uncharacterized membrane protein (DUF4010 family)
MNEGFESVVTLLVATVGGLAIGVERQWSGHASGPGARFAGVRTFALLGAIGGLAGRLWVWGAAGPAVALLAAAGALIVMAYFAGSRHDIDATTEVASLVVVAAGMTAGLGQTAIASGVIAVTALLLFEKSRLHDLVGRLEGPEIEAAFRFAVMAVVILPILPEGPFGPLGGVRPRQLWMLVLFFSGLSFAGYLARRLVGESRGYAVTGLLGGLVSSTSVTLSFARLSREHDALHVPLGQGVVAANTVLYARVIVAASVLSPELAVALVPMLAAPFLIGAALSTAGFRHARPSEVATGLPPNPLQLRGALEMALLFQVVLFVVYAVGQRLGTEGLLATAAVVGLTEADALTLSMATSVREARLTDTLAAQAVAVGLLSNTLVKLALTWTVGRGRFRSLTVAVLGAMALALALAAAFLA